MPLKKIIPNEFYGVLSQNISESCIDDVTEQISNLGYAVLNSEYSDIEIESISLKFDALRDDYIKNYGESYLKKIGELHTVRALLTHGEEVFMRLALDKNVLNVLRKLISGKFILNQQNGLINPPEEYFSQSAWHRDLAYQHFVSSRPLAINVIYCVDDFTSENGATYVIPASHKSEKFPSPTFIKNNAIQIEADAGSFILLDCMLFHAGGYNQTKNPRRAVNHVYNIPYFKQQINIPTNIKNDNLSCDEESILGFHYMEPESVSKYLDIRSKK